MSDAKATVQALLRPADIEIDGGRPWDIQVHNEGFYPRVLRYGSLGLGESYMEGWWDAGQLDELFYRLLCFDVRPPLSLSWRILSHNVMYLLFNPQRRSKAFEIGERHYDRGDDLYRAMLGHTMVYSCAYWQEAGGLDAAQEAKLRLVCRKLGLKPGMRLLDIGCGWGSLAQYAAEHYESEVVGITVSRNQVEEGLRRCQGLPVEIRLQDYRSVEGTFDRVVSIGMFEHVGRKNYRGFMETVERVLRDDGLFLLHTIGLAYTGWTTDPWIAKYIFPNSMLPSLAQITRASEGLFVIEDIQNIGAHYDKTLMAWFHNFDRHWEDLRPQYGDIFYRMWKYYLLACAGAFRARRNQVWQIVFSKRGVPGGYVPAR
ncbi:MAG TPA: cyclopropane fatty acyl phospholipid synthase [bacterium]|nr:cyclopropane fatty acyl phospholipid synthase [bacterium]